MPEYPDAKTEYVQSPIAIGTRKLARKWGVSYKTICDQCRREKWVEERMQFQGKVRAESEREAIETLAEARARWAKTYRAMQAAGLKGLNKLAPRTAGEAGRLIDLGIRGERLHREEQDDEETAETARQIVLKWGDEHDDT